MNTIKQDPELRYGSSGFTIKEAYNAPESEILEINMSMTVLTGSGDDWNPHDEE
ncbi:MAG: hypothetical protein J6X91_09070 [Bacteroidales bacterium]|nr:hypothetical protein [Bacteroidales bacterium]